MDKSGRIIGMSIFVLGILALLYVLGTAFIMFTSPPGELFSMPDVPPDAITAAGLGGAAVIVLIRIALLFVMTLAASLIAARGIQLYLGSSERRPAREEASPAE